MLRGRIFLTPLDGERHIHTMDLSVVYPPRTEDDGWPVPFGKGHFSGSTREHPTMPSETSPILVKQLHCSPDVSSPLSGVSLFLHWYYLFRTGGAEANLWKDVGMR